MTVFFVIADQSYLPLLVRPDRILEANSKLTSGATWERAGASARA
jgi:hypothetical protein